MSDFINEMKRRINECSIFKDNFDEYEHGEQLNEEDVYNATKMLDSLGENARRNLEIGILQDNLVKLGFEYYAPNKIDFFENEKNSIFIKFNSEYCFIGGEHDCKRFYYNSPTWQQDVLNKVKELIDE